MAEKRPLEAVFRVVINGYAADMTATGTLDELVGLTRKLAAHDDIQPGNSPLLWPPKTNGNGGGTTAPATGAPLCPVHGVAMKPSTKGAGWFCSKKMPDGSYCKEKV